MSRHWTRNSDKAIGKAIEAIPTCKDAGGWDKGEINTEHKCEELNVTKETKEIHRDWSSELCGRDIDNGVTQPRMFRWNWHAVGDDEPDGRVKERKFYVRGQHVQRRALGMFGHLKKGWCGRDRLRSTRTSSCCTCFLSLWSCDRLCASSCPRRLSRLHQEMKGNLSLDSHLLFPKIDATEIAAVFCQFSFPSFAIIALFPFREGKHTFQEAWITPWCRAPGHKPIQCFWGRSLESKARKTKGGLASFYPRK